MELKKLLKFTPLLAALVGCVSVREERVRQSCQKIEYRGYWERHKPVYRCWHGRNRIIIRKKPWY